MPNPTEKHPAIERTLTSLMGKSRVEVIRNGMCMTCNATNITEEDFDDAISLKEYEISGMCMECQRSFFGSED
jgi:hypothetical protein